MSACASVQAGSNEWQNWPENSGDSRALSTNGRASLSLTLILIRSLRGWRISSKSDPSTMSSSASWLLKSSNDWMSNQPSILLEKLTLSTLANTKFIIGSEQNKNMKLSLSLWFVKSAKNLEQRCSQMERQHLANSWDNSRDGKDCWAKNQLESNLNKTAKT
jgi:hypothetical protein